VLSKGPQINTVPSVQGYLYTNTLKSGLESYGWQVATQQQWSDRPVGEIIGQIPLPGTPLTAGMVITLQVSSGSVMPLDVNLGNIITLESADLPSDTLRPGESVELTLHWKSRVNNIEQPYKVFVHLLGPTGKLVTQMDREPQDGRSPTTTWTSDTTVQDRYALEIPRDAARGMYQLRVGMYPANNPSTRLPVIDPGRTTADSNSILIKELTIAP
jgi:beta-lactam-binding protein with PASTA domain